MLKKLSYKKPKSRATFETIVKIELVNSQYNYFKHLARINYTKKLF